MINFDIAFDNGDAILGHYFEDSKADIEGYITANCADPRINLISTARCNLAYIDIRLPVINPKNYLFLVYCHGLDDALHAAGTHYIKRAVNTDRFVNSFFYSMSCLTGRELGGSLIADGCHVFIGYREVAEALLGAYKAMSIECDNHGIKRFIQGDRADVCFAAMKTNFTTQVDALVAAGETVLAAYLLSNRDALVFQGKPDLTIADFTLDA